MDRLGKNKYPEKTSLNLVIREKSSADTSKVLLYGLICFILIGAFCKFGVIDRLAAAQDAEGSVSGAKANLDQIKEKNSDYEAVKAEYAKYFSINQKEGEAGYADCMDALSILENKLMPFGRISQISLTSNVLSLKLTGVNLNMTSSIVDDLKLSPAVQSVEIYNAGIGSQAADGSVTMTIFLVPKGGAAADES